MLLGVVLVFVFFPKHAAEEAMLVHFLAEDTLPARRDAGVADAGFVRPR